MDKTHGQRLWEVGRVMDQEWEDLSETRRRGWERMASSVANPLLERIAELEAEVAELQPLYAIDEFANAMKDGGVDLSFEMQYEDARCKWSVRGVPLSKIAETTLKMNQICNIDSSSENRG